MNDPLKEEIDNFGDAFATSRADTTPPKQEDWEAEFDRKFVDCLYDDEVPTIVDPSRWEEVTTREIKAFIHLLLREERIATLEKARKELYDPLCENILDRLLAQERGDSPSEEPTHKP